MRSSAVVLVAVLAACSPIRDLPPPPPPDAPAQRLSPERVRTLELLRRVGIIGASQSAGFGDGIPLHSTIDAALLVEHAVFDATSSAQFLKPLVIGEVEVAAMALRRPTLVIATDYLFWYAYGAKDLGARNEHLDLGLAKLESLACPVVVGDLPDMAGASEQMISPAQIPTAEILASFNARIRAWASERPDIHVLPVASWLHGLKTGRVFELFGRRVSLAADTAMQWDGLHPSPRGQALLSLLVLSELGRIYGGLEPGDVLADPHVVVAAARSAQMKSK